MKSSFRLSSLFAFSALALLCAFLLAFVGFWAYNSTQLKKVAVQESQIGKEISELAKYQNWTLDYVRIYLALGILSKNKMPPEQGIQLSDEIWMISRNYGFDPLLIPAIVYQESRGNPNAKGRFRSGAESGAYGLMQLKLPTAQAIGKRFGIEIENAEDLMHPEISVVIGSAYLMRLVGRYGDLKKAIIAYNIGQGGVDTKIRSRSPIPTNYYEEVLAKYRKLKRLIYEQIGE